MRTGVLIAIIVAILAATGAFVFFNNAEAPEVGDENQNVESASSETLVRSATFQVPESDATVTLSDGSALFEVAPESLAEGSIIMVPEAYAEWTNGTRTEAATVVAVNSGGTGVFLYLVVFAIEDGQAVKKSETYLGDRITITHVGIGELVHDGEADYRVTVQTLVRAEDEAYAAVPSVPETRTFYVTNGALAEIEVGADDT